MRSPLLISTILPLSVHCYSVLPLHPSQHLQSRPRVSLYLSPLPVTQTLDLGRLHKTRLSSSNDEEIAALEEKLRRLKENTDAEEEQDATTTGEKISSTAKIPDVAAELFAEKRFKISDDSTNMMVTGEEIPNTRISEPYEELLSEQWKSRESSGGGIGIKDIATAVAVLLGIIAFSQVPIGQEDLDKYSTAKPSTAIDLGDLNPVGGSEGQLESSY